MTLLNLSGTTVPSRYIAGFCNSGVGEGVFLRAWQRNSSERCGARRGNNPSLSPLLFSVIFLLPSLGTGEDSIASRHISTSVQV